MTLPHGKMNKVKGAFDKVVEWDKKIIKKCQDKWNLTDYQVVCISFAKGFIIGAISVSYTHLTLPTKRIV